MLYSLFFCCPNQGLLPKYIETIQNILKGADHLLLPHIKLSLEAKRGKLVSLPHFLHVF